MTQETGWIFDGLSRYNEFRDEVGTDGGTVTYQAIQRRVVFQFRRYKYVCLKASGYFAEGDLEETSSGGIDISASLGIFDIEAPLVASIGQAGSVERRKWVCLSDDYEPTEPGLNTMRRVQVWEKRGPWKDYEWSEVS